MSLLFFVFLCFYSEETAKNPVNAELNVCIDYCR